MKTANNYRETIKEFLHRNPSTKVRGYQVETIQESLSLFVEKDYKALLIESPTGSGKTIMAIATMAILMDELGLERCGWVAMRRNLLSQAAEVASSFGVADRIIPISMFDKAPPKVDVLVVDEGHHDATVSMSSLHKKLSPAKVLGLSATPQRQDRAELIFQRSISKAGIYELVRLGYLAHPDLFVLPDWEVETVVGAYLADKARWGKSIFFFFTMEECQAALERLKGAGVRAEIVHAQSNREKILTDFEEGRLEALVNMAILTEGFDSPDLETVFVRPSSQALTQQMGGRVLRVAQGLRKKIVQSQDSPSPFSSLAPIGRSFKLKDGAWAALDYDSETIARLISQSNRRMGDQFHRISQATHEAIQFLTDEKKKQPGPEIEIEAQIEAD